MLIVLGHIDIREGQLALALALSQEHVTRSLAEDGCLAHGVYVDPQRPNTLRFVEEWADHDALRRHFAVPASIGFVKALGPLAASRPSMRIFEATPTTV